MGIKEIHIEFTEQQIKKYNGLIPAFGNFHTAGRNLLKLCHRITYLPKELEKSLVHPDEAVQSESGQILGNQSSLRLSSLAAIVIHLRGQSETARLAAIEAVKGLKLLPDLIYDIFYDLQQQYEETRLPICKVLYRVKEYLHEDLSKTLAYFDENDDPVGRENFLLLFTYRQNHTVPISTIKFMIWKFRQCHGVNSHSLRSSLGNAIGTHIADTGLVPTSIKILCNDVAEVQIAFLIPFFATQSVSNRTLEMLLPLFDSPFDIRCHGIRQRLDLNKRPNLQQRVDVQRVLLGNMWRASGTRPTRKIVLKMVQLLFHDDPIIREVAGNILAKHESDEYLHIFARLLRDSDIDVSDMAYDVLRNLSKRFKLPATCIDIFRALFDDKSIDVEVKTLVFEILSD